jgi:hypothetical protein
MWKAISGQYAPLAQSVEGGESSHTFIHFPMNLWPLLLWVLIFAAMPTPSTLAWRWAFQFHQTEVSDSMMTVSKSSKAT